VDRREVEDHLDPLEAPDHRADKGCPVEQEIREFRANQADREENILKTTSEKSVHLC